MTTWSARKNALSIESAWRRCCSWPNGAGSARVQHKEVKHVPNHQCSPPRIARSVDNSSLELTGNRSIRLDQLWRELTQERQQAIAARLAQMIARQAEAMHFSPPEKEESHE